MIVIIVSIIICLIGFIIGFYLGVKWLGKQYDIHCEKIEKNADKFADYYSMLLQWLKMKQDDKTIADYFVKNDYKHVAVYGMNDFAYALIKELKKLNIEIAFCIDRNADNLFVEHDVFRPDEDLPEADVCIVALPELYDDIRKMLEKKMNCSIVSIENVIWNE